MDIKIKMEHDFSDLIKQAAFSQINTALNKVGMMMERNAKMVCPTDTGRLKNSITHTNDKNTAYVGTNVEYAPYVEMGTVNTDAQPYLKPAIADHIQEYEQIIEQNLKG